MADTAIIQMGNLQSHPDMQTFSCGGLGLVERHVLALHHAGVRQIFIYDPKGVWKPGERVLSLSPTTVAAVHELPEFPAPGVLWVRADSVIHRKWVDAARSLERLGIFLGTAQSGAKGRVLSRGFLEHGDSQWTGVAFFPASLRAELARNLAHDPESGDIFFVHGLLEKERNAAKPGENWFFKQVRDRYDIREAETLLFYSLRKPQDGWVARTFNRPMSLPVSRLLARTRLTPNQLTVLNAGFAVAAAVVLFLGHPVFGWNLWLSGALGGVLMQLCSIYDGCDGEVARVKFQFSHLGDWLDTIFDDITNCLFFAGVAAWSYYYTGQNRFIYMGIGAFIGQWISNVVMYYYLIKVAGTGNNQDYKLGSPDKPDGGWVGRILGRLKYLTKRDFHLFSFMWMGIFGVLWVGAYLIFAFAVVTASILLVQHVLLLRRLARGEQVRHA